MCALSLRLKQQVKRRLAAVAEQIFEILEETIREYEEETQRQRTQLDMQPRVLLLKSELEPEPQNNKAVQHPQPEVKEEKDVINIQLCSDLDPESTDETAPPTESELEITPAEGALHSCSFCGKSFRFKHRLRRHLLVHTGEKFHCPVCSKAFSRKDTVQLHMAVHSDSRPFSCSICGLSMKRSCDLRRHLLRHHQTHKLNQKQSSEQRQNKSSIRNKAVNLRRGQPEKEEEQPTMRHPLTFVPQPPRGGAKRSKKKRHSQRRLCLICCKGFRCDSELLVHMRVHSGERPFSCPVCIRTFARKSSLRTHMTLHSGQKPFSCSDCDKSFTTRQHLKRHASLHLNTGQRKLRRETGAGSGLDQEAGTGPELDPKTGTQPEVSENGDQDSVPHTRGLIYCSL